jgi:NAD(P)-dependent dehydrogenase (short-subunit alcohol dehydrogenase family)
MSTFTKATSFPISSYSHREIHSSFNALRKHWPDSETRVALFNAGVPVFKPFLDTTPEEFQSLADVNMIAASTFAREAILSFKELSIDNNGKRGTLMFSGASAALRGGTLTSAFSMGKFALRSLSQSLGKEFGKDNIHVRSLTDFNGAGLFKKLVTSAGCTCRQLFLDPV